MDGACPLNERAKLELHQLTAFPKSHLRLSLSPFDTNIIPHLAPKVKGFWAEILHKVKAIFGVEIVQLDEESIKRRAAALRATAKRKEGLRPLC